MADRPATLRDLAELSDGGGTIGVGGVVEDGGVVVEDGGVAVEDGGVAVPLLVTLMASFWPAEQWPGIAQT